MLVAQHINCAEDEAKLIWHNRTVSLESLQEAFKENETWSEALQADSMFV